jgi:hypothetical protein
MWAEHVEFMKGMTNKHTVVDENENGRHFGRYTRVTVDK